MLPISVRNIPICSTGLSESLAPDTGRGPSGDAPRTPITLAIARLCDDEEGEDCPDAPLLSARTPPLGGANWSLA